MTGYWSTLAVVALVVIVVTALVVLTLLMSLVRAYPALGQAKRPAVLRCVWLVAVVYALSPWDLLNEPVLIDDIGVLLVARLLLARGRRSAARG